MSLYLILATFALLFIATLVARLVGIAGLLRVFSLV